MWALALGVAWIVFLGGCTRPDGPEVYASCKPREARRIENDGTLTAALARQAAENQSYRDCLERRSVRVAR